MALKEEPIELQGELSLRLIEGKWVVMLDEHLQARMLDALPELGEEPLPIMLDGRINKCAGGKGGVIILAKSCPPKV